MDFPHGLYQTSIAPAPSALAKQSLLLPFPGGVSVRAFQGQVGKKSLCQVAEMSRCHFRGRGGPLKSRLCGQAVEVAGSSCWVLRRPRESRRPWSPGSQSRSFSGIPAQPDFLGADFSSPTQLPCASSS